MNQSEDNAFTEADFLYDKEVVCPLCEKKIKVRVVKRSGLRLIKKTATPFHTINTLIPSFMMSGCATTVDMQLWSPYF
jgi:Uncharacterized protein conserved in bacteria (DUF2225).